MDRIHYAGDTLLTGTEIARAVIDYAQALAEVGASASAEIPTVDADGSLRRTRLLVGPASQLLSNEEKSAHEELIDDALVTHLRAQAEHLRRHGAPGAQAATGGATSADTWDGLEDV